MKKQYALLVAMCLACGTPFSPSLLNSGFSAMAQASSTITGVVTDESGAPLIGASVLVKGTDTGMATDTEGRFNIRAKVGDVLVISYVGQQSKEIQVTSLSEMHITLASGSTSLDEVVVTALGIKKDRKSLGYAIDEIDSDELMKNKSNNAINSLSGKIAGVSITQGSGAAGAGSQIILRGGTSLERDNQPLFVVDGIIYDNSTSVIGNSAFDGTTSTSSTNSNRVMDINPEDIESMSVLKGPAASALYGSRASAGVVIITTKKGKEGAVEVNLSAKYTTTWAKNLPKYQKRYKHGFVQDNYDADGNYLNTTYDDFAYNSWGAPAQPGEKI